MERRYCTAIVKAVKASSGAGAGSVYTRGFLERLQTLHDRLETHDPGAASAGDGTKWWGKVVGGLERTITALVAGSEDDMVRPVLIGCNPSIEHSHVVHSLRCRMTGGRTNRMSQTSHPRGLCL